jgi:hypothetical protein
MVWETNAQEKFKTMVAKIPVFHRHITEEAVTKRAEENAGFRKAGLVEEEDIVSAFFRDVPTPFYSLMIRLMEQTGFDYKKYGFPRNGNGKSVK